MTCFFIYLHLPLTFPGERVEIRKLLILAEIKNSFSFSNGTGGLLLLDKTHMYNGSNRTSMHGKKT